MRSRLSRRDVEVFAAAVDGRTPGARDTDVADRLRDLVEVADYVRASSASTARRDFVAELRAELMSAAPTELPVEPKTVESAEPPRHRATEPQRLRRRLSVAASAFVVLGGTLGLVAASAQAMPGDMLYPVKRATEDVEVMLQDGPSEGRTRLDHAATRLAEVESLTAEDGPDVDDLISKTLADFTADANVGGTLLVDSYRDGGSAGDIDEVRAFTANSAVRLEGLADAMPQSAAYEYANAAQAIRGLDSSAVSACPICGDGAPPISLNGDLMTAVALVLDKTNLVPADSAPDSTPPSSDQATSPTDQTLDPDLELPTLPILPSESESGPSTDDDSSTGPDDGDDSDGSDGGSDPVGDGIDDIEDGVDDTIDDLPTGDGDGGVDQLLEPITKPVDELLGGILGLP